MNKFELNELEGVIIKFKSYWKYTFVFEGKTDKYLIFCIYNGGGDSDNIYRYYAPSERVFYLHDYDKIGVVSKETGELIYTHKGE